MTYRPNFKRNKFSFSFGASYNFFTIDYARINRNTGVRFFYNSTLSYRRCFITTGSDYNISRKIKFGLRLITFYDLDGDLAEPFLLPFPSFNYTF